ncbi:hypothetical protein BN1723_013622 [Verticillium longisporum]|uniref:HAUS augmin-like complex subunit 3 N-terminal domain-containing protein n=1 Tax=Verticillium longisporum TaxID=100787 RepID=A0A0G4LUG4_VERLO|nr:hypothetical protein BN1723_013622 [Verticillium longisporum]
MDLTALRDLLSRYGRSTLPDESILQDALNDSNYGTAFKEWISTHLGTENLLSKDELSLYLSLDQAGLVDELVASKELATVEAIGEAELRAAVQELDRSTTIINKQTEALRQHHNALAKLADSNARSTESRREMEATRASRRAAERRALGSKSQVEELSQHLGYRTSDMGQQAVTTTESIHEVIEEALRSDDKLLSSLQKLGWELDPEDPEETQNVATLRECCMRVIKYTVEMTRTRLDRTYLEALESAPRSEHTDAPAGEVKALQEELESLYAEILPVAQMSVEQQYLEPALKSLSDKNGQSVGRSMAAISYILACLGYLLDNINRLEARVVAVQSYQAAAATLIDTAKAELAVPAVAATPKKAHPVQPASPTRARVPTSTPGPRRRRSSGNFNDEPPIEALLRLLTINLAASSADSSDGPTLLETLRVLSRAREGRAAKAYDVTRNAQESFEHSVVTHLTDARRAAQLLRDSILAESSFGEEVKLVDPEVECLIIELSQQIADIQSRIEQIDAERAGIAGANGEKQNGFVLRWAG